MASADMVNEWLAAESDTRAGRSVYGLSSAGRPEAAESHKRRGDLSGAPSVVGG